MTAKFTVRVVAFHPLTRNTLRGFMTVRIAELALTIRDVAVHEHANGSRWAQLPAKPQIDRAGTARRNADGKIEYTAILEFENRAVRDAFSAAVVRALLEFEPRAFEGEAVS
jgi:hypothetical protein